MDFPKQNIPEKKKDKEWYERCVLALYRSSKDNERFRHEKVKDYENYDFYNGKFNIKQFEHVTTINGITNPARLVNYPLIQPKIDLLAGELISNDLQFSTFVTNKNAIKKKTEDLITATAESLLAPIRKELEEILGTELSDEEQQQMIPEDIEEMTSVNYRTNIEKQIHAGVNWLIRKHGLKHLFKHNFYSLAITGKQFYKNEIRNNEPVPKKIDSRSMIYDIDSDEEFLHNCAYAGHENYYTIHEVMDKYRDKIYQNFSKKEAKELMDNLEKLTNVNSHKDRKSAFEGWNTDYFLDTQNATLKISEIHMQWKGLKKFKFVEIPNNYDPENPYCKVVKDDYRPKKGETLIEKPVSWVYEGVMLGGRYLVVWGEKADQVRYEDNYFDTKLDYFGCVRNNFNGRTLSIVDALKNLQMLYNIIHYHIELAIGRSGGKAMVYDVSQKPKNLPLDDVLYHAKNSGLIIINTAQEGMPSNFNQFQSVDFTLSQSVGQLINLKVVIEDTADKLTGITAARAGISKSGDLVGVNERNVMQSSLLTAPYFEIHYKVVGDVLQDLADKLRYCVRRSKNDYYVDIFGDNGIQVMKIDREISYDQVGIHIQNSAKEVLKKQKMEQVLGTFMQQGEMDPMTLMKAMNAESSTEIEMIVTNGIKEANSIAERQKEQEMQIQQQATEVQKQTNEMDMAKTQLKSQTDLQIAKMDNDTKREIAGIQRETSENVQDQKRQADLDKQMLIDRNSEEREMMNQENNTES